MHLEEILVPMSFCATLFGLYYLRSRENLSLIDKGMNPRKNYGGPKPYAYMKYALLLVGAGLGLFIAYMVDMIYLRELTKWVGDNGRVHYDNDPAIYFALLAVGGGLGMFFAYRIEKRDWIDKKVEDN